MTAKQQQIPFGDDNQKSNNGTGNNNSNRESIRLA